MKPFDSPSSCDHIQPLEDFSRRHRYGRRSFNRVNAVGSNLSVAAQWTVWPVSEIPQYVTIDKYEDFAITRAIRKGHRARGRVG